METHWTKRKKIVLGKGFGDYLTRERYGFTSRTRDAGEIPIIRIIFALLVFVSSFVLLSGRLMYLTVVRGAYYQDLSSNNRVREVVIPAPRGVIYDRNGETLARNKPIYRVCESVNGPCTFISREAALEKEAKGENVDTVIGREYPEGAATAHVVGYMSEISSEELIRNNEQLQNMSSSYCGRCYRLGDWMGISGTEVAFEQILRGTAGRKLIEVNAQHTVQKELAKIEPVAGTNVHLSIDLKLQKLAAQLLAGVKGAIVASNPQTGEVYALYSSPSFDSNAFVGETTDAGMVNDLFTSPDKPLFDRTISGLYPPGSTFKIVTAAAGLEEGKISEDTVIEDTGIITIGAFSFSNWYFTQYGKTEGPVGIVKAIARSNDIFFYKVGEWTGEEKVEEWAGKFGLGTTSGIEIPGEEKGNIRSDREWYLGDTYHLAIGQGDLLTTPLQVNAMAATIANGGKRCKPTVLKVQSAECEDIGLSKKTVELITEGMKEACSEGGTAYPLFKFKVQSSKLKVEEGNMQENSVDAVDDGVEIPIACKTGTAEFGDPDKTHAWLTAFSPIEDPQIAITVLVEGGGEGSSVAAPMVKELLKEWFENDESG